MSLDLDDLPSCTACSLAEHRRNVVPGVGSGSSGILIMGLGPSPKELERRAKISRGLRGQVRTIEQRRHMSEARLGKLHIRTAPTERPTNRDIVWAAGFYEGEGYVTSRLQARISQVNPWPLERMRALFGGSVYTYTHPSRPNEQPCTVWALSGSRARGFLMTIYSLLSPRRQAQIKAELAKWTNSKPVADAA